MSRNSRSRLRSFRLPTLLRLLVVVGMIAALAYGAMLAMVTFLHPESHEITQTVKLPDPPR